MSSLERALARENARVLDDARRIQDSLSVRALALEPVPRVAMFHDESPSQATRFEARIAAITVSLKAQVEHDLRTQAAHFEGKLAEAHRALDDTTRQLASRSRTQRTALLRRFAAAAHRHTLHRGWRQWRCVALERGVAAAALQRRALQRLRSAWSAFRHKTAIAGWFARAESNGALQRHTHTSHALRTSGTAASVAHRAATAAANSAHIAFAAATHAAAAASTSIESKLLDRFTAEQEAVLRGKIEDELLLRVATQRFAAVRSIDSAAKWEMEVQWAQELRLATAESQRLEEKISMLQSSVTTESVKTNGSEHTASLANGSESVKAQVELATLQLQLGEKMREQLESEVAAARSAQLAAETALAESKLESMRSAQELVAAKRASLTGTATLEGQVEQLVGQVQALQRSYATTRENLARRSDALSHANLTSSRLEEELRTVNEELAWQVAGRAADKEAHCASLSVVQKKLSKVKAHESGEIATLRAALQGKVSVQSELSEMQAERLQQRARRVARLAQRLTRSTLAQRWTVWASAVWRAGVITRSSKVVSTLRSAVEQQESTIALLVEQRETANEALAYATANARNAAELRERDIAFAAVKEARIAAARLLADTRAREEATAREEEVRALAVADRATKGLAAKAELHPSSSAARKDVGRPMHIAEGGENRPPPPPPPPPPPRLPRAGESREVDSPAGSVLSRYTQQREALATRMLIQGNN